MDSSAFGFRRDHVAGSSKSDAADEPACLVAQQILLWCSMQVVVVALSENMPGGWRSPAIARDRRLFNYGGKLQHSFTAHPEPCLQTGARLHEARQLWCVTQYPDPRPLCAILPQVPMAGSLKTPLRSLFPSASLRWCTIWPSLGATRSSSTSRFGISPSPSTLRTNLVLASCSAVGENNPVVYQPEAHWGYHAVNAYELGTGAETQVELLDVLVPKFSFTRSNADSLFLHRWRWTSAAATQSSTRICATSPASSLLSILGASACPRDTAGRQRWSQRPLSADGALKFDMETGQVLRHQFVGGRRGGECFFAAKSSVPGYREGEDDRYLLVCTVHPDTGVSDLYIVDAKTMEGPIAIVRIPTRVPNGFHALWVPESRYRRRRCKGTFRGTAQSGSILPAPALHTEGTASGAGRRCCGEEGRRTALGAACAPVNLQK